MGTKRLFLHLSTRLCSVGFRPWPKGWNRTNRTVTRWSYDWTRDMEPDQTNQRDSCGFTGSPPKRRSFRSWVWS